MSRTHKRNRSGGVLGVVLLMVAGFAVAAVLAVIVVVRTVHTTERNGHVSIETPAGSLEIRKQRKLDPASIGVPVYPGAVTTEHGHGGGASFAWTSKDGATDRAMSVAGAEFITGDTPDRVVDFYRQKLSDWKFEAKPNHHWEFEYTAGDWKRIVGINSKGDGTHIGVATFGEPAGN